MSQHDSNYARDQFLQKKQELEHYDEQNQAAGEERHVRYLLTKFGLAKQKTRLLEFAKSRTGHRFLTLDLFNEQFPTFPLLLAFNHKAGDGLHENEKATLPALFKRFQDAPFVLPYEEFYESAVERANGRAVGLLFPRKGIMRGLIIHDREGLEGLFVRGMTITYCGGTRDAPRYLYMNAFASLIEAICNKGHGWRPEIE